MTSVWGWLSPTFVSLAPCVLQRPREDMDVMIIALKTNLSLHTFFSKFAPGTACPRTLHLTQRAKKAHCAFDVVAPGAAPARRPR